MRRCRHCGKKTVNRPRGLCWTCYYTAEVRTLYPGTTSKFGRRGIDHAGRRRPAPAPTQALPGSPQKIAVLRERASLGLELWHSDDATLQRGRERRKVG